MKKQLLQDLSKTKTLTSSRLVLILLFSLLQLATSIYRKDAFHILDKFVVLDNVRTNL